MRTAWFIVIESLDRFWVDYEGKAYGPFEDQAHAEREGQRLAETYGDRRRQIELWSPDRDGKLKRTWFQPGAPSLADRIEAA